MRRLLKLHPDSRCSAAAHIEVGVARLRANRLVLSYIVTGKMSDVRMPPVMAATRSDDLWRHTCFEAFICASSGSEYYEFNFAPSTQWAAYRFSSYRSGMRKQRHAPARERRTQRRFGDESIDAKLHGCTTGENSCAKQSA